MSTALVIFLGSKDVFLFTLKQNPCKSRMNSELRSSGFQQNKRLTNFKR